MKRIIPILTVIILAAGCKKDKNITPNPQPGVTKKLVHIQEVEYPANDITFTYDAQGRMKTSETSSFLSTYDYKGSTVDYTGFLKTENRVYSSAVLTLNNNGLATSMDYTYHPTAITTKHYDYTYQYDVAGNLTKAETQQNPGLQTILLEWANGNISKETYATNNNPTAYWIFTYGNDLDKTGLNRHFTLYSNGLGGNFSKNLHTKAEKYNANNVKVDEEINSFEFDTEGYLLKKTSYWQQSNTTEHYIYTYK